MKTPEEIAEPITRLSTHAEAFRAIIDAIRDEREEAYKLRARIAELEKRISELDPYGRGVVKSGTEF